MFTSSELEGIPIELEQLFKELEKRIMIDIIHRIKINSEITRSADWQIHRLSQLGESKRVIKKYIKNTLELSNKEISHLYKDVIRQGYAYDEQLYKTKGKPIIPFADNEPLQQLINATTTQTAGELKNITQSMGFATKMNDKVVFTSMAEYYQRTLDGAIMDISSGVFDYNTVLKRVVNELTNSGLRTVEYASGWSNRVTVASRRAVMTGITQVTAQINEDNAEQLGTNDFEVSWHIGARPTHQVWQGKVYSKKELHTICGLDTGEGLCGWNCYHSYYPFIKGISERIYTDEQLEEMNARENIPVEYNGKGYTAYQATQKQRKLETQMRAERQKIKLLQDGGADENEVIIARAKYRGTSHEYVQFSKAMNLPQQRERVTIDGLGAIGKGKWKVDKSSHSGIMDVGRDKNMSIFTNIDSPIEQRNTAKGNPNAILIFDRPLNNRQQNILNSLTEYDSKAIVSKKSINMKDLSALTAYTNDEFAMFTKGNERLIIRGNSYSVNVDVDYAKSLNEQGYRWSGHTHPGIDFNCLVASPGDKQILKCFNQNKTCVYNSQGKYLDFEKE